MTKIGINLLTKVALNGNIIMYKSRLITDKTERGILMKKRVLSIVCVIALVVTMISAGAIYAIGTDTAPLTDEAFSFDGASFVNTDWTAVNNTPEFGETGVKLSTVNDTTYATVKYKDKYDLTNGFTFEYSAKSKVNNLTIAEGTYFNGVKIGNVTVAMDSFIKPVILVDGAVKATGNALVNASAGIDIRNWVNGTEPAIDGIKYTVAYDVTAQTVTYKGFHTNTEVFSVVYTDEAELVDVESAEIALYHNNNKRSFATYKSVKLTGAAAPTPPAPPTVLYGTGLVCNSTTPAVAKKWKFSHSESGINNTSGGIDLQADNVKANMTATYKDNFILTEGFTFNYTVYGTTTKNVGNNPGLIYFGARIGNITAYLTPVDTMDAMVLKIAVDGTVVATSDAIYDETHPFWTRETAASNLEYYISNYCLGSSVFTLNYDPATKTVTYSLTLSGADQGSVSFVDTADTVDVSDAELVLISNRAYNSPAYYKNIKLVGATCTAHEYDDDNDATCNKCGDVRVVEGGESTLPKGEALTEAWAPESFVDTDWTGDTSAFRDGRFVLYGQSESVHKDIWTIKNYDLSSGFKFKGTLTMKNGHNNYYGEWCSAYFGNADLNVELRIKNDGSRLSTVKDDTYTAILLYNGVELATYDLDKTPNGEYEVTYKNGKISVALKEVKLDWTLADTTVAKEVPVTAYLGDAKIGLRLTDNYGPENGREWKSVNLAPLPAESGDGNDEEEIVRGETLTTWAPEKFEEADWLDSEGKFTANGDFLIETGNGTKTIWTTKNYDMSGGFKFKGTLAMKNGYNNYYGEWCSAYFGNELANLELRIKNDSPDNNAKDNTYTAYILYKGEELASSDLLVLPNGEYELTYKDGKVSVSLGGVALKWTLTAGGEATSVDVAGADFTYAKLGLRLTGNWCPNGRKWSVISLTSLSGKGGAATTGDARNIVVPAVVMLVSAVSAAFVLLKKKARA